MIKIQNVSKSFDGGQSYAVRDVSMTIDEGETLILLGSSGCGKTTTMKMINRLIDLTDGTIEVDGKDVMQQDVVSLRRSIGYVFQGVGLFPHITVADNISMVMKLQGEPANKRRRRAEELLELIDMPPGEFADRLPHELSGGQRQRVGVARALATDPKYLLMDEPFGALDPITRDALQNEVIRLKEKLKKTIVFVTHDLFEALKLADRIAVMHAGHLEQVGTINEIATSPATDFVREMFEQPANQLAAFQKHF